MGKEVINLPDTPRLPYSSAIRAGNFIFVSGQTGSVDAEGREVKGIEAQTRQCFEKVKQVLAVAGMSLDDVIKVTVFLRNEADFASMNEVYQGYFAEDKPARSTIVVGLPRPDMLIEIECIAYVNPVS